jgi:hypothetical protein
MSDEEPRRPERDLQGNVIDWERWTAAGLERLRTPEAKLWKVDCRCAHPDAHWVLAEYSPQGPQYDRWLLHFHHTDPDCPAIKILVAWDN